MVSCSWVEGHSRTVATSAYRNTLSRCGEKNEYLEEHIDRLSDSELVIKELTPSLRDDFPSFFDSVAFVDNPDWSDCYCSGYENPFRS